MATAFVPEVTKVDDLFRPPPVTSSNPLVNIYSRFSQWRTSLGLPSPGTVENLQKEVKCTFIQPVYREILLNSLSYASFQLYLRRCTR